MPDSTNPDPPGTFAAIGRPLPRKEDARLLTGRGRFSDDFALTGQAHAVMVRSDHPHARLRSVDADDARAMPGVLAVLTGADLAADGRPGAIDHSPLPSTRHDLKLHGPGGGEVFVGPHALLPVDRVRHVGEGVAMVVAETRAQALDAAEAVVVDCEPLAWVAGAEDAVADGAPAVWDEAPGNLCVDTTFGDAVATAAAFARAAHVVRARFHVGRVTGVPLEPRAALGVHDAATGRYTLWAGSGGAVRQRREIAAVLGIEPDRLRVVSADVGGNFGTRNRVYVEFALVLLAARITGRPVKFTATRGESFLSDYQGRDLVTEVELALDGDGRFLAFRASNLSNVGARVVSLSPLGKGSALVTGPYAIPAATVRARAAFTNTVPTQAYRSSGRPEVTYAIERLVDMAAEALGVDRVALRRRNLVPAGDMPWTNPVGATYDSGDYAAAMDAAMRLADWDGFAARAARSRSRGHRLGRGIACYVESSIGAPRERAAIAVLPSGVVEVVIGTQPSGQGHETSFAQVVADALGIGFEQVEIVLGDTDRVSLGGGSHSGRSMRHAGTVMLLAAADLVASARAVAAHVLGADETDVEFAGGLFRAGASNRSASLFDLARAEDAGELPPRLRGRLAVSRDNEMHAPVYPNGCAVCEVEVDPETGAVAITRYATVDDVGRAINPLILHGQAHGAVAQGVGQALWEACVVDPASGQTLTGSLMDYPLPRADALPPIDTEIVEVLSPTNPLGIKAGGEGGTTPALAAVVNAIVDALREYGVRDVEMPATPLRVWSALRAACRGD